MSRPWITAGLLFLAVLLLGWIIWRIVYRWLHKLAARTETIWDDVLLHALRPTLLILTIAAAAAIAMKAPEIPKGLLQPMQMGLKIGAMLAVVLFIDRMIIGWLTFSNKESQEGGGRGIIRLSVHVVVYVVGGLMVLDTMGVKVTAILTTLGVGSLALALALQPTLASFVAGLQIAVEHSVNKGDVISLGSGQKGKVVDIGWRTTKLLASDNNMIYVPNSKLVGELLTNYNQPEKNLTVGLTFGVHFDSDLDKVEALCKTLAKKAVEKVAGVPRDIEPTVRFRAFNESAIEVAIWTPLAEHDEQFLVRHELIKLIQKEFAAQKIIIPYPIRTVEMVEEKSEIQNPKSEKSI
jgi:small-conductance mechanosensitive channel